MRPVWFLILLLLVSCAPQHPVSDQITGDVVSGLLPDGLSWTDNGLTFRVLDVREIPPPQHRTIKSRTFPGGKHVLVEVEVVNEGRVERRLREPESMHIVDEIGRVTKPMPFGDQSAYDVAQPLSYVSYLRSGERRSGAYIFPLGASAEQLRMHVFTLNGEVQLLLHSPFGGNRGQYLDEACNPTPGRFLMFNEQNGNQVGVKTLTTVDNGNRGLITGVEVYVRKEQNFKTWDAYDVVVTLRKEGWQQVSQDELRVPMSDVAPESSCPTVKIGEKMSVTGFNQVQAMHVLLQENGKSVAHASKKLELKDFSR